MLNPYSLRLAVEQRNYDDIFNPNIKVGYVRASLEANISLTYAHKRNIDVRGVGGFLKNDYRRRGTVAPGAYNLTGQGFNDYRYDDYDFGRTESTGFWSQQIHQREGGQSAAWRTLFAGPEQHQPPLSNEARRQDLPSKLPLKPYFDFGYYDDAKPINNNLEFADQVWWQGGLALEFGKGVFSA